MPDIQILIEPITLDDPEKVIKLVKFVGQLDESNVDEKSKVIYDLITEIPESTTLIFDFSGLEYMNSKSIGYLSDWFSKTKEKNGRLIIAQPRENIMDILTVVGLAKIIPMTLTLDEAKLEAMRP